MAHETEKDFRELAIKGVSTMTQFKEGDEVAWIVKYIKRDTTLAAIHDGVSISLETSPGNTVLVHNPQLHPAAALDVNKGLLAENERLRKELKGSNANHELYERRWYLREEEIELLRIKKKVAVEWIKELMDFLEFIYNHPEFENSLKAYEWIMFQIKMIMAKYNEPVGEER